MVKCLLSLSWTKLLKTFALFLLPSAVLLLIGNHIWEYFVCIDYSFTTVENPKIYSQFYQSVHGKIDFVNKLKANLSFADRNKANAKGTNLKSEWIDTLNYTVDYGDKTCKENRDGNPLKTTFVKMLRHWKSIADKHNVSYFLTYGSLIGAIRDSNFIPYDLDVDIMVDDVAYELLANISSKRNFICSDPSDRNIYLVVQPYWRIDRTNLNKKRVNCMGKVI